MKGQRLCFDHTSLVMVNRGEMVGSRECFISHYQLLLPIDASSLKRCTFKRSVCVLCLCVCMFVCMCSAYGDQEKASDPLELELQVGISHNVGARNQTWVFCKAASAFNHWMFLSSPAFNLFIKTSGMYIFSSIWFLVVEQKALLWICWDNKPN